MTQIGLQAGTSETFIGPTSADNKMVIPANSAAIIHNVIPVSGFRWTQDVFEGIDIELVVNEVTFKTSIQITEGVRRPLLLAGPAEVRWNATIIVSYDLVPGSTIQTKIVPPATEAEIEIPARKTLTLSKLWVDWIGGGRDREVVMISKGAREVSGFTLWGNERFTGPLILKIKNLRPFSHVISYFINEDSATLEGLGVIQSSIGQRELRVEKSTDLKVWQPAISHLVTDEKPAFYRFRISQ